MSASILEMMSRTGDIKTIKQLNQALNEDKKPTKQEILEFFTKASGIIQSLPEYDVIGMDALVDRLRYDLAHIRSRKDDINSINKLSVKIGVSRPYLAQFRDGGMVCMNIMNRIAEAFQIRYLIENYQDSIHGSIE